MHRIKKNFDLNTPKYTAMSVYRDTCAFVQTISLYY